MDGELCRMCGGDGRVGNALGGSTATCPSCHGSGRRADTSARFRDVTKTKPSHHHTAEAAPRGPRGPVTPEGTQLAAEVSACASLPADAETRLLAELSNHDSAHGRCNKPFLKSVRKEDWA